VHGKLSIVLNPAYAAGPTETARSAVFWKNGSVPSFRVLYSMIRKTQRARYDQIQRTAQNNLGVQAHRR
jgi:hypothetical protein